MVGNGNLSWVMSQKSTEKIQALNGLHIYSYNEVKHIFNKSFKCKLLHNFLHLTPTFILIFSRKEA